MKKKYNDNSADENEFEVDEPEEIQNNASDDDWTPDKDNSGGRRTSTRLRNIPKSRAPIIDASSTDEEGGSEEESGKRKGKGRPHVRQPVKKHKVSSSTMLISNKSSDNNSAKSDSEPTSTTTQNSTSLTPVAKLNNKDYTSGAFVVLKTDATNLEKDPPLWKIDGKALLQKYIPFEQDGKTYYKNTSVYSGWTINNKDNYHPVTVIFKQQTRKEHIVEFKRDQIKLLLNPRVVLHKCSNGESSEVSSSSPSKIPVTKDKVEPPKPKIKVKSFAVMPVEEKKPEPPTPSVVDKTAVIVNSLMTPVHKVNKDYTSGAFLVLRTEAANVDPPIWKIDGKSLLQKYCAYTNEGKTLYKNTAEYCGWSLNTKRNYFPVTAVFKQQIKKEHIVELQRIKWDEPEESEGDSN